MVHRMGLGWVVGFWWGVASLRVVSLGSLRRSRSALSTVPLLLVLVVWGAPCASPVDSHLGPHLFAQRLSEGGRLTRYRNAYPTWRKLLRRAPLHMVVASAGVVVPLAAPIALFLQRSLPFPLKFENKLSISTPHSQPSPAMLSFGVQARS